MDYYTSLIIVVWVALAVLCVLVFENNRLTRVEKHVLYFTYIVVALAALAEWLGVKFNGNTAIPTWLLKLVKFFDYIFTPFCGGIVILQFRRNGIIQKIITVILAINLLFQTICIFTDWVTVIDQTAHTYSHGKLYVVYIAIYAAVLLLAIVEFAMYGMKFRKHNQVSLYCILFIVAIGVILQEVWDFKVAYAAITLGFAFLFIHHNEFSHLEADDTIQEQMIQITIDPLTGILNRYAYEESLREVELKEDLVIFSVDINGLKNTNDTLGHKAGDELICGAAKTISNVFNECGKCFRTGGDEFIAIVNASEEKTNELLSSLEKKSSEWKGKTVKELSLSTGFASVKELPNASVDVLVATADQRMYKIKSDYYLSRGIERRVVRENKN